MAAHTLARRICVAGLAVLFLACVLSMTNKLRADSADEPRTTLAFRTPFGAAALRTGETVRLGVVDVSQYEKIRVVVGERVGLATGVVIRLVIMEGSEQVADLDALTLSPRGQITKVYEVPGATLGIVAETRVGPGGSNAVDVLIYGSQ